MGEGITLDTFVEFLVLCESNGFIELKLCLEELKAKLQSLLGGGACSPSSSPSGTDDRVSLQKDKRSSALLLGKGFSFDGTPSQSLSFDLEFSAIKTPEIVSTPLSAKEESHEHSNIIATGRHSKEHDTQSREVDGHCSVNGTCCSVTAEMKECDVSKSSAHNHDDHDDVDSTNSSFISCRSNPEKINDSTADGGDSWNVEDSSVGSEKNANSSLTKPFLSQTDDSSTKIGCDLMSVPYFNLEEGGEEEEGRGGGVRSESVKDDVDCSERVIAQTDDDVIIEEEEEEQVIKSHDNHVISDDSSSEDDADDKLENLFSQMNILSSKKKNATKHIPTRKSLSVFIVSDSEDVEVISDNEENVPPTPPSPPCKATPTYHTPCTPASGIMFWGSPSKDNVGVQTTGACKGHRRPLGLQNYFDSPSALLLRTPVDRPTRAPPSLTTPSANKNFTRFKTTMTQELYDLFNQTVFDNKLPSDLKIIWNKKLRTTAGYCCYQDRALGPRQAKIELSTKVVDCYDRIRDTLVHEMCHAATWIIDGVKGGGHGREWRAWADKANAVYPDLKPITRCHSYAIQYKYTYKCTTCDFTTGRHSKSVNLSTARCPYCLSKLELFPKLKVDGTPASERKLNRYAQFVKDHYSQVKSGSPWRSHKEVMERLKEIYHQKDTNRQCLVSP